MVRLDLVRAALYVRVSSAEQRKGWSLEKQEVDLREYCRRMGYRVVRLFVEVDSGRNHRRPKIRMLGELAAVGAYDRLVVWRRDRLWRRTRFDTEMDDFLRVFGVPIESMMVGPQADNASTRFINRVSAAQAEFESESLQERTEAGKLMCAQNGRWPEAVPPWFYKPRGWTKGRPATDLRVDEERAAQVRNLFHLVVRGVPIREASQMTGWRYHRLALRVLHNPIFKGEAVYRGIKIPFPPIVDESLWQRAQDALASRRRNPGERGKGAGPPSSRAAAPWGACAPQPKQVWRRLERLGLCDPAFMGQETRWGRAARKPVGAGRQEAEERQRRARDAAWNAHKARTTVPALRPEKPEP